MIHRSLIKAPARNSVKVLWNVEADKVLWRWLLGADRRIKVCPVRPLSVEDDGVFSSWMFQRGSDGTYVRATKVMVAIHRRAMDRSRGGFKARPGDDAVSELYAAIRAFKGWEV